jgi:hypothetical protein
MKLWEIRYATDGMRTRVMTGLVYGADEEEVVRAVSMTGGHVITARPRRKRFRHYFVDKKAVAGRLLEGLRFLISTMPPGTALARLVSEGADKRDRELLTPAHVVLQGGGSFTDALKALELFDPPTLAMLKVGEETATLRDAIPFALAQVKARNTHARKFTLIAVWFIMEIWTIVGSLQLLNTMGFEMLRGRVQATDAVGAKFLRDLAFAQFINDALLWLSYGFFAFTTFVGIAWWQNRSRPEHWAHRLVRSVPLIGNYLDHVGFSVAMQVFSRLLRARLGVTRAIEVTRASTWLPNVRDYWDKVAESIVYSTPREAMDRVPLDVNERAQIAAQQTADHLADVAETISEGRTEKAETGYKKIVAAMIWIGSLYIGIAFMNLAYVASLQSATTESSIDQLRNMMNN